MEQVIWKEFPFYGNRYLVSNEGNVRGPSGTILKPNLRQGYKVVYISISHSKKKTIPVHKIVALTFIPNTELGDWIEFVNESDRLALNKYAGWSEKKEYLINAIYQDL